MAATSSVKLHSSTRLPAVPTLSPLEREFVGAVLEDCVDKLAVLGGIMPNYADKPSAVESVMGDELHQILENQRRLENKFDQLTLSGDRGKLVRRDEAHSLSTAAQAASSGRVVSENMQKLQRDREFVQSVVCDMMEEVMSTGQFTALSSQLEECQLEKVQMEETILREEECRKRVRELKRELVEQRKKKESELMRLDEEIAHLKDQMQETKAKTALEEKCSKKYSEVSVEVARRRYGNKEESLRLDEEHLRQQLSGEETVSGRINEYLQTQYEELAVQLDYWMTKHEQDLDMKSRDLHDLKQSKANVLQRTGELTKQFKECEEVVVDHRAMKEKLRLKAEQEAKEIRIVTKLQAWWRGMMVRKQLGPYAPPKKKKGKGKKKGKKKKK